MNTKSKVLRTPVHQWRGLMFCCSVGLGIALAQPAGAFQQRMDRDAISPHKLPDDKGPEAQTPALTPAKAGAAPKIVVDEVTHDFGDVWSGPVLQHAFTIRNEGDVPLEITRVKPSCGCTLAGSYPRTLPPGESGKFPFSIDSKKLRNRFSKSITVTSNDLATPQLRLTLAGNCKRYVEVSPPSAHFGRVFGAEAKERVIKISNNTDKPLELKMASAPTSTRFKTELTETQPGKEYELKVTMVPPYKEGNWREQIKLDTNVDKEQSLMIMATATVPARIDVQPRQVFIGGPASRYTRQVLHVQNYGEQPIKVTEVSADDPSLKLELEENREGMAYSVKMSWPSDYQVPVTGTTITIKTNDPESPVLTVPVRGSRVARRDTPVDRRGAEALVGKPAPSFSLTTSAGKTLSNADGTITVLDFFAPNCGFCKKQMPRVEKLRPPYEAKGIRFVNVAQTMRGKKYPDDEIKKILGDLGVHAELAIDTDNNVGPLFQAGSYPTMVVLDKNGIVQAVNLGNIPDLETRLTGQLDALLAGKSVPTELRTASRTPRKPEEGKTALRPAEELVGKPAPMFHLTTTGGAAISNTDETITVLDFFAPNCGFCKKQMPRVEALRSEYESKGVRFVNVAQTMRGQKFPEDQIKKILSDLKIEAPLAIDTDNAVGPLFRATSFPTMVVLGKTGKVEAVNIGNIGDLETRLKAQLDALVAGKPVPQIQAEAPRAPSRRPAEELVGSPAPAFSLKTLGGKTVSSDEFKQNKATVLNFVAPNCGFCKRQLPKVEEVRKEYESKGVRFVNVSQTMRKEFTNEEAAEIFSKAGSGLEIAPDAGNNVGRQFKATSYPTMVVVGPDGKIHHVNVGAKADIDQMLKTQLDVLLNGKPSAAADTPPAKVAGTK